MNELSMTTQEALWKLSEMQDGFTVDDLDGVSMQRLRNGGFAKCIGVVRDNAKKPGGKKQVHELTDKGLRAALKFEKKVEHYAKLMGLMEGKQWHSNQ